MGILDRFKKKKEPEKEEVEKKPKIKLKKKEKKKEKEEVKKQTVLTPDGRLASVPKKETRAKKVKPQKEDTGQAYRILKRPLITEKASSLGIYRQYVFAVAPSANKIEVRKAIRKVYGVDPIKVNLMNISGKNVRYGKTEGRTKDWKKAIVTLPPGQKIEIQEGV